jgi:hypothetical protein
VHILQLKNNPSLDAEMERGLRLVMVRFKNYSIEEINNCCTCVVVTFT